MVLYHLVGGNKNYTPKGRRHKTEMGQQVAQMHESYMMMMMRGGIGLDESLEFELRNGSDK